MFRATSFQYSTTNFSCSSEIIFVLFERRCFVASEIPLRVKNFVHSHSNLLSTLGIVGAFLLKNYPNEWKEKLKGLRQIGWSRNDKMWEGRLVIEGKMLKTNIGMELAANAILNSLEILLDEERIKFEEHD